MPLNLLPGVAEKWAPAIVYLNEKERFPISDPEALQKILHSTPQMDGTIQIRLGSRLFFIDLVEMSSSNVDIVALSVTRHCAIGKPRILGGTVITERFAGHPKAADHRELILGMEILTIQPYGTISAQCCKEDWMDVREMDRDSTARAQNLRQRVIRIATERMLQAKSIAQKESNEELHALCTKVSTFLASKDNYKLLDLGEQTSTKKAISSIGKAIDHLHDSAVPDAAYQSQEGNASANLKNEQRILLTQHGKSPQSSHNEVHELKLALEAKDEEIRTTKRSHSQVKAQLASENQRLIQRNHQLLLANVELKENTEVFRLQANEAEGKAKRLTGRLSDAETETELARDRVLETSNELKEAYQQLKKTKDELLNLFLTSGRNIMDKDKQIRKLEQQLTKLEEQTQQNSTEVISELEKELEVTEKASTDESKKSTKLDEQPADQFKDYYAELFKAVPEFRWLKRNPESSEKASAGKSKKFVKQEEQLTEQIEEELGYQELKSDLKPTKGVLKEKTDEAASAIKRHAEKLQKAEGSKEKCRCKDKESYLESVEEHVENLRGVLEDVIRNDRSPWSASAEESDVIMRDTMEKALSRVSIYQGRKRRRTEGPDFEY
ncbi:hypothetical protein GCG54_00015154 [Colletotrichum gloeosporioides]|uniref:Uncharacterized protein n=1 Tax=Colletotrichum gloeosporioides TaxID=474922 RepID=A0A8H4FH24_COLGL|nr:uncharacterized protein GCG54_00015154 [Colletotrichum gloeosporioides]KAF3801932.1 hypothetical protein GCG54_00015154 [Colletotrichum gloeosporioides]